MTALPPRGLSTLTATLFADRQFEVLNGIRNKSLKAIASLESNRGRTAIDVGAGSGSIAAILAETCGSLGKVIAIECDPYALAGLRLLSEKMVEQGLNVEVVDACLNSSRSEKIFYFSRLLPGNGSLHKSDVGSGAVIEERHVRSQTLQDLNIDEAVSIVMIDAQGNGFNIIKGGAEIIKEKRPPIIFEYMHLNNNGVAPQDVLSFFDQIDYSLYDFCGHRIENVESMEQNPFWDRIALPNEGDYYDALSTSFSEARSQLALPEGIALSEKWRDGQLHSVEVVSLKTAARLAQVPVHSTEFEKPSYLIGVRQFRRGNETASIARFDKATIISWQNWPSTVLWKALLEEKYWVEEIGHTSARLIYASEHWLNEDSSLSLGLKNPIVSIQIRDGFLLGGESNYFHWITNWLPRMRMFELFADFLPPIENAKILVSTQLSAAQVESLCMLGAKDSNVVKLNMAFNYALEDVYISTVSGASMISPSSANWLRSRLPPTSRGSSKRIYISRNDVGGGRRKVINDTEFRSFLEARGFETVVLTGLSFQEQINLFASAEYVVAPHGAGVANLVFSPDGCRVAILENSWKHDWLVDFANVIGCRAQMVVCEDVIDVELEKAYEHDPETASEIRRNRNMIVSLAEMESIIDAWDQGSSIISE